MKKEQHLNETIINGSRIYVENGEVKTQLSDEIRKIGYMSVDDSRRITLEAVRKIYELAGEL